MSFAAVANDWCSVSGNVLQSTLTPIVRGTPFAGGNQAAAKALLDYSIALTSGEAAKLQPLLPSEAR